MTIRQEDELSTFLTAKAVPVGDDDGNIGGTIFADDVSIFADAAPVTARVLDPAVVPIASASLQQQYSMTAVDSPMTPAYFKVQAPVAIPESISIICEGVVLVIKRRWYNSSVYRLLCFAIFWNGFMINWNIIAIATETWSMAVFGIIHDLVGLYLMYNVVLTFVNSSYITVQDGRITVVSRPFRGWKAPSSVDTTNIREFRCRRNVSVGRRSVTTNFDVHALDANRIETVIIGELATLNEALFLEQELEKHLGLQG